VTLRDRKKLPKLNARARPAEGRRDELYRANRRRGGIAPRCGAARDIVGDEPFAVILPDELVLKTPGD